MTVSALRLFLTVQWVSLQCVIVVFRDHTHSLYYHYLDSLFGCVAFWNPGMVNDARIWGEYEKKRKEFRDKRQTYGRTS